MRSSRRKDRIWGPSELKRIGRDFLFLARLVPQRMREDRLEPPEVWIAEDDYEQRWRQESLARCERLFAGLLPEAPPAPLARIWGSGGSHCLTLMLEGGKPCGLSLQLDLRREDGDFLTPLLEMCSRSGLVLVLPGGALCAPETSGLAAGIRRAGCRFMPETRNFLTEADISRI